MAEKEKRPAPRPKTDAQRQSDFVRQQEANSAKLAAAAAKPVKNRPINGAVAAAARGPMGDSVTANPVSTARGNVPPGAPVAPRQAVPPSRASQGMAGVTGAITPRAALPTPAVAKGYREGLAAGAAKVAAKTAKKAAAPAKAASTFQASPSSEFKTAAAIKAKPGLAGALARNKGNNERLAKERMKKASRKG